MNASIRHEIIEKITELLNEHGVLRPNQTAKITISIVDVPRVTVGMADEVDDIQFLTKIINRMPRYGIRMQNIINYCHITFDKIKSNSLSDMLKYRNLGKLSLKELGNILLAEGIVCPWMKELAAEDLDKLPIKELGLSICAENTLHLYKMNTVRDFRRKTVSELQQMPNFGVKTIQEIQNVMQKRGINLGWFV